MGNQPSKPPPPDVDLLPPRFDRRISPLERLPLAPFESAFGQEKRDRLFTSYFAPANTVSLAGSFRPDYEEKAKVALALNVAKSPKASVAAANDAQLNLGYVSGGGLSESGAPLADVLFAAKLGTDGSARAVASAFHAESGLGLYATLPLDYFIERQQRRQIGEMEDQEALVQEARAAGVGHGLGGRATRYTSLKASSPISYPAAVAAASLGAPVSEVVSPRTVTPAAASSASGDVMVTGTAASCASPALPEVGLRFVDKQDRFSLGLHASPVQPYPLKAWAVGAMGDGGGDVTVGVQLATDAFRAFPSAQEALMGKGRLAGGNGSSGIGPASLGHATLPSDAFNTAGTSAGLSRVRTPSSPLAEFSKRCDLGAAISISQAPLYELSLAYDGSSKEVVAGFLYNQVLRRRVYNILEDNRVKGIFNYLDLGVELRRPLIANVQQANGAPASFALAASWQLNRNWMMKGRVGTNDVSASLVFKNWWSTAFTGCVTGSFDRRTYTSGVGFYISAERGGALDYQKAVQGNETVARHMALAASPTHSERVSRTIDREPLLPPPVSNTASYSAADAAIAAAGRAPRYAGEQDAVKRSVGKEKESRFL